MAKKAGIQSIAQSDKVGLYSIIFDGNNETELRSFLNKYRENSKLNRDFRAIVEAINKIIANGALERYFRPEGKLTIELQLCPSTREGCGCTACVSQTKYLS